MTKKYNKGSRNQNAPELHGKPPVSGDDSKGNKRNHKEKTSKTDEYKNVFLFKKNSNIFIPI